MTGSFAFAASTGRTATTFLVKSLGKLPGIVALHEGHALRNEKIPVLPLINIHNRKAWYSREYADEIVREMRSQSVMEKAAGGASCCIDVAYYNAPLVDSLSQRFPESPVIVLFRRCEGFVRSATILHGEDREPAGWPDPDKKLTPREQFISMGRLRPEKGTADDLKWHRWSGVCRNIWLWSRINQHLFRFSESHNGCTVLYYETLLENPGQFWEQCLGALGLLSPDNLQVCLNQSSTKVNTRQHYDIGKLSCWSQEEREMYTKLALPLEKKIYEQ